MKIAVCDDKGSIHGVFAGTKYVALYDYAQDELDSAAKRLLDVSMLDSGEALAARLRDEGADAVLVGEMGEAERAMLLSAGIVPVTGYTGPSDMAADLLVAGMLPLKPDAGFGGCAGGCSGCAGGCGSTGNCGSGCQGCCG